MADIADLEIGLHRLDSGYSAELRFSQPNSDTDIVPERGPMTLDLEQLRASELDLAAYGQQLADGLFGDPALRAAFEKARAVAQSQDMQLRLRLYIGPSAPELHRLHWEALRDPQSGALLLTDESILFARYLSSLDWRPVRLRPQSSLRALVVIANPADLASYKPGGRQLEPVDVQGELERATANLGTIPATALLSGGSANLNNLVEHLREGYDILYLVCHGALIQGEPWLWLEDEQGAVARVSGSDLVTRLKELQQRPRLIVLASCQSAGAGDNPGVGDNGEIAALGPRLAEAGVPAVIAMQGNVTMQTIAQFMPVFFKELQRDGQIDRAVVAARGAVRDRPDFWMPVLFMRLKSGRIWYVPGFGDDRKGFEKWPALIRSIRQGRCTPILSSHLSEELLGSSRDVAQKWAEAYHFPLAPHARDDLPQVAQYLAVNQDSRFPRDELIEYLRREIVQRYGDKLPEDLRDATLTQLFEHLGQRRREQNPTDPYAVLAGLPFAVYITINASDLLEGALKADGKEPVIELCRWNEDIETLPSIYDSEPDYRPTPQRPLVYHLFGRFEEPDSLVITEDDYFDYLIGTTGNKDLIPAAVRRALADTALLFLGFRMDDWNFRVLFRSLMSQEGRGRRSRYAHIAAQIEPEEGRTLEPERARSYLENYFQSTDISIYWGTTEDFIAELMKRSEEAKP
jgi:CHAT domain-containing protein/SIR2-like protein